MSSHRVCPVVKYDDSEQCDHCRTVHEPRGECWGSPAFEPMAECPCDFDPDDPHCDSYLEEDDETDGEDEDSE